MIRGVSVFLGITLGLLSCGSSTSDSPPPTTKGALDLVPAENEVAGWTIDRSVNKGGDTAPMSGDSKLAVEGLIDGGASPFFNEPNIPKLFVWQNYLNKTIAAAQPEGAQLYTYVIEMPSAEQAQGLYAAVLQLSEYDRKKGTTEDWKPISPSLGTAGRIQDTGSQWWINFHQGVFYVEVLLSPSNGPAPDYLPSDVDLKNEAIKFARAIAGKI
jgi:hypothetical protein